MAITALATSNTQIGPAQFADMEQITTARFKVDSPNDLKPAIGANRTVTVSAGAGFAGGSRIRSTGTETVTCDSQSSGSRYDAVVIRIDWSSATQKVAVVKGNATTVPVNTSAAPNTAQINRIPGVMYDALVCTVRVSAGATTVAGLTDYRMWGGDGGPMRVTSGALDSPNLFDARLGTFIQTDRGTFTKRLDDDGVWRDVGTASNPWKAWTPNIRYYGSDPVNGTTGGTLANLGSNGKAYGYYRVVDGLLDGIVSVNTGSGNQFGTGSLTFDLPVACASWSYDVWNMGHIFTSTANGGDGNFDWHAEALIKSNWTRAMIWTNPRIDDNRLVPHKSSTNGGAGEGVPWINGGWSVGSVYSFKVSYPVS